MAENSNASSVNPIDTSIRKSSGKPKSIVWETHIKQGKEISKGHWSATCNYCNEFWYKGSPASLEAHLGNSCNKAPPDVRSLFLSRLATRELDASTSKKRKLNVQSQLSDFCAAGILRSLDQNQKKTLFINIIIGSTLKTLAEENLIEGGGLKQWVDTHVVWARGTFRRILLAADNFYEKMGKKHKERKMLMSQMRSYRYRTEPFDVPFENNESPTTCDDDDYDEEQTTSEVQDVEFPEEEALNIEELLNLDAADFTNDLGEIVFNTNFESSEEEHGNVQINDAESNVDEENWDPEKENSQLHLPACGLLVRSRFHNNLRTLQRLDTWSTEELNMSKKNRKRWEYEVKLWRALLDTSVKFNTINDVNQRAIVLDLFFGSLDNECPLNVDNINYRPPIYFEVEIAEAEDNNGDNYDYGALEGSSAQHCPRRTSNTGLIFQTLAAGYRTHKALWGFVLWEEGFEEEFCLEGTWCRMVLDPLLKIVTRRFNGKSIRQWGEAKSLASNFRKGNSARKPDFWFIVKDYEKLWKKLYDVEIFLLQVYETNLRFFIMDQPGLPLCRVRKIFDFQILYDYSDEISVLYFTHGLWKIRLGLEIHNVINNVCGEIQRQQRKPLINSSGVPAELSVRDFISFPSP
ncbi:2328_t:CDS:10 [Dentiscutata heterogama]|uniref:2328_t:CDS:1 n=1 Tax=Dentiscutata heterogama TaxID=1316150 RepID=A0ACA9KTV7_9GLOM|nr:2328_t:CDS:10 [Dentiscutata heterogama]